MVLMEQTQVNKLTASNKPPTKIAALGGQEKLLPYCNFELNENDVLYMRVASGGGYGDPLERDPALVQKDVANSIVSLDAAREIYGVVVQEPGLQLDLEATRQLRKKMREQEIDGSR
jgi:N-methylhydantoinase B/oxoprolinase/acetone carboxylase alpha subunit